MNYKVQKMNPVEKIRMIEEVSQKEFASMLGFENKDRYLHHMRNFTQDIIDKVKAKYDRDITMEIINHLRYKCRELNRQLKNSKSDIKPKNPDPSIDSLLDKI